MNRVTMADPSSRVRASLRDDRYINLYTTLIPCIGDHHSTETACRASRASNAPGLILKVSRDENGDFTIQKVEEF